MSLPFTVQPGRDEPPASFASRLATANGLTARELCSDFRIVFQEIVDGRSQPIARIAELAGADPDALMKHAFIRDGQTIIHRGQTLNRSTMRHGAIRVCAACLRADIRANKHLDPETSVHGRAAWLIDAIRNCPVHNCGLVRIPGSDARGMEHDFAAQIAASIPKLERLIAAAPRGKSTSLEAYVLARLAGTGGSKFLDQLDLFAAIKLCQVLGAVALHGRSVNLKALADEKWLLAGARGFEIANGGAAGVETLLDELKNAADGRSRNDGPQVVYGKVYTWLASSLEEPAYDPVRAIVAQHIQANLPLGPDAAIFGRPVRKRTVHSVRSLSLESRQNSKRLRKLLRAAGVIGDDQMALSDHNVLFDALAGSAAVVEMANCLSLPAARDYLNAPRTQADLLVKHGFIKPHMSGTSLFGARDQYAIPDLDDFLGRLTRSAQRVGRPSHRQVTIQSAAKQACCSAADIVRLILEDRLGWVGRLQGVRGYRSVLVNVDQVKDAVRGPGHGGVPLRTVAQKLSTTDRVVTALIEAGHLATFTGINPINRCPQTLVAPAELARFQKAYVSLHVLAKERKRHHLAMKFALDEAGIRPAFDHARIGARFYRRSDC